MGTQTTLPYLEQFLKPAAPGAPQPGGGGLAPMPRVPQTQPFVQPQTAPVAPQAAPLAQAAPVAPPPVQAPQGGAQRAKAFQAGGGGITSKAPTILTYLGAAAPQQQGQRLYDAITTGQSLGNSTYGGQRLDASILQQGAGNYQNQTPVPQASSSWDAQGMYGTHQGMNLTADQSDEEIIRGMGQAATWQDKYGRDVSGDRAKAEGELARRATGRELQAALGKGDFGMLQAFLKSDQGYQENKGEASGAIDEAKLKLLAHEKNLGRGAVVADRAALEEQMGPQADSATQAKINELLRQGRAQYAKAGIASGGNQDAFGIDNRARHAGSALGATNMAAGNKYFDQAKALQEKMGAAEESRLKPIREKIDALNKKLEEIGE